jgi:hypothetical protein
MSFYLCGALGHFMTQADEYRRWAEDCDWDAERAANPTIEKQYRELARRWRVMADSVEARFRAPPSKDTGDLGTRH